MKQPATHLATALIAALSATTAPAARAQDLEKIAQYEIVNAVGLPGELRPSLNDTPRPQPCRTGTSTGSMGTRATRIAFGGSHPSCSGAKARQVNLPAGSMTTVIYYPELTRSKITGRVARTELRVTAITRPFTRGASPKTLHLLAVTEQPEIPIEVDGQPMTLRRLETTAVQPGKTRFAITSEGTRLAAGSFDERDHATCILFDAPAGELRAVVTGATPSPTTEDRNTPLEEIAQYQVINAVGLPGELAVSLNGRMRPHPYDAGTTMGSMGTRATEIAYGGSHSACTGTASKTVPLPAGTVTTVVFHPAITRSKTSGEILRAELEIATLTHPFTRRAGPKTLHLLVATEQALLPVAVNGRTVPVKRLEATPIELEETAFEITTGNEQLAGGNFDERDHLACILFDAPDGGLRAVVFD